MSLLPEENGNIVTHPGSESEILKLLSDSYLYKDILDKLIENRLLKLDGSNIMLTQKGREISNSVFIEFIN